MNLRRIDLENLGSMITIKGSDNCLGYLIHFTEHGTYDALHGQVPVTKEEADIHNNLLDKALLDGMNKATKGQMTPLPFYFKAKEKKIKTFTGATVNGNVVVTGTKVTLEKLSSSGNLQVWAGKIHKDDESITLKLMN